MNKRDLDRFKEDVYNFLVNEIQAALHDCSGCKYFSLGGDEYPCHECSRLERIDEYMEAEQ